MAYNNIGNFYKNLKIMRSIKKLWKTDIKFEKFLKENLEKMD